MTINHKTLEMARDVIQMLGAPSPLHFSKEEIIKWQECNAAIDEALAQPEQPDLDAICQDLQEKTYNQAMRIAELEAQPEQEPFAWYYFSADGKRHFVDDAGSLGLRKPLYTTPPQRKPLDEWQPIETAPRDGSAVWGYKNGKQGVARRIPRDDCEMWEFCGISSDIEIAPHLMPTHWMPLPDAPIEAAHGIKE